MPAYHLAQFNIARAKGPTDGPVMAEFMANLDRINSLAEASPGFVWRFQTEDGSATSVRAFEDPDLLLNLSTWESVESFKHYVYKTVHAEFLPRRREWFEPVPELPVLVMWWVPAGTEPSIDECVAKLQQLADQGPSADAFTFRTAFPAPDEASQNKP